jgi:hypothetical protein
MKHMWTMFTVCLTVPAFASGWHYVLQNKQLLLWYLSCILKQLLLMFFTKCISLSESRSVINMYKEVLMIACENLHFILINFICFHRIQYLFKPKPGESHPNHSFYRTLFPKIIQDIDVSCYFILKLTS